MAQSDFPNIVKELRIKRKLSQKNVELLTGIDRTTISAYETGKRDPSIENVIKLADLYNVSLDQLFGRKIRK